MNDSTSDLPVRVPQQQFALVAVCFLISGFAALLYETVWLRQFAILLGTSEQALAVVLASYMGGLAIGSLVASRVVDTIRRPLLTYGVLELGIALTALFVPIGISLAYSIQSSVLGGRPEPPAAGGMLQVLFCFGTAFGLILIPTALMGATLPLLARHVVTSDEELGPKIGLLYAINTAGAVAGTLAAAFVFLPSLGLGRTTWVGVAGNALVFLVVLALVRVRSDVLDEKDVQAATDESRANVESNESAGAKRKDKRSRKKRRDNASKSTTQSSSSNPGEPPSQERRYRWILALAAISGAVSFCYEIIFTRMLGQMLGGSVYAFATMLAGFLLGIALGGAVASRLATDRATSARWFVYAQAAAGICTLITFNFVDAMVLWPWREWAGTSTTTVQVIASILALLPTSTLVGATFPLAIRVYAKDETEAAGAAAKVYFWNVLGGIGGAIATGVVVLPLLQYHGATAVAIILNILIAVTAALVLKVRQVHLLFPVVALLLVALRFPTPPENVLRVSALSGRLSQGEILFNHVGKSASVTVLRSEGEIFFQTNGLPESTLQPLGSSEIHRYSGYWLSSLPVMVRPECKSMLIIGLGGGVAAELVPPSVESIDVIEIEPAVVQANRAIAGERTYDPLSDPRVRIILNDGRNALALTDKKYDAIVSQPSHPWTAGASHLYSREFDELIRDHLNPGGIFLQWMSTDFVDVSLTRSMGATMLDVFPHARLYEPIQRVFMFVASDQPIQPELVKADSSGITLCKFDPRNRSLFQRLGVVTPTHLFSKLMLDEQALRSVCEGAELITDERNLLAMRAPFVMEVVEKFEVENELDKELAVSRSLDDAKRLCPSLDLKSYLSRRVRYRNSEWIEQSGLPLLVDPSDRATVESKVSRLSKSTEEWLEQVKRSAKQYPQNSDLAFEVISNKILGSPVELSNEEETAMRQALSSEHRLAIELLEKLMAGDWMAARRRDADLARWPVDDVAYQIAVRLRLPWRLESAPVERVARCNEAIQIIDQSAAFANSEGLAFFRVAAAVGANRPNAALGTTESLVNMMKRARDLDDKSALAAGASNLMRCYSVLRDAGLFQVNPPARYREVLAEVENVLADVSRQ